MEEEWDPVILLHVITCIPPGVDAVRLLQGLDCVQCRHNLPGLDDVRFRCNLGLDPVQLCLFVLADLCKNLCLSIIIWFYVVKKWHCSASEQLVALFESVCLSTASWYDGVRWCKSERVAGIDREQDLICVSYLFTGRKVLPYYYRGSEDHVDHHWLF